MKAIIIGATSGIGRELAKQMSNAGYTLGITGRRVHLLDSLEEELPGDCIKLSMDLSDLAESERGFRRLLDDMGDVDIVIINSGTGVMDPQFPLSGDLKTIAVNVTGFTLIANLAYHYFVEKGVGHIVGISSVAALVGGSVVAYNASKSYVSTYLEGLSLKLGALRKSIFITDIRPGFVDTDMAKGDNLFWKAPVEKAAEQIFQAIKEKRRVAYITKRWRLIAWFLYCLPFAAYRKMVS